VTERITSTTNPRVKKLARLKDRRGREAQQRFLIEGHRELQRAVGAGVAIDAVAYAPDLAGPPEHELMRRLADAGSEVIELGGEAFSRMSMRRHPNGLIGVAPRVTRSLDDLMLPAQPLVLVVEGVEKPGNLGAILRTADGAGVDAVVVADERLDPTNPNVIRASQGAIFTVPWAVAGTDATITWLATHALRLVAASPEAERSLWEAELTGGVAIAVGAEDVGLSPPLRDPATTVTIPMAGTGDSLNASVAAAVMLYEAVRQRR
jgi:TrmH family RNA methyltransferase